MIEQAGEAISLIDTDIKRMLGSPVGSVVQAGTTSSRFLLDSKKCCRLIHCTGARICESKRISTIPCSGCTPATVAGSGLASPGHWRCKCASRA